MTTESKNVAIAVIAIIAAVAGGAVGFMTAGGLAASDALSTAEGSAFMTGHLELVLTDENGAIKQYVQTDNIITSRGFDTMVDLVFGEPTSGTGCDTDGCNANATDSKFTFIGIGTSAQTAVVGDDGEVAEITGCDRIQDTTITGDSGTTTQTVATLDAQFSGSVCAGGIQEATLTNTGTGALPTAGETLARQTFGSITVGASDTLTVTWNITFS